MAKSEVKKNIPVTKTKPKKTPLGSMVAGLVREGLSKYLKTGGVIAILVVSALYLTASTVCDLNPEITACVYVSDSIPAPTLEP